MIKNTLLSFQEFSSSGGGSISSSSSSGDVEQFIDEESLKKSCRVCTFDNPNTPEARHVVLLTRGGKNKQTNNLVGGGLLPHY
jgi:hypothetical protein